MKLFKDALVKVLKELDKNEAKIFFDILARKLKETNDNNRLQSIN